MAEKKPTPPTEPRIVFEASGTVGTPEPKAKTPTKKGKKP